METYLSVLMDLVDVVVAKCEADEAPALGADINALQAHLRGLAAEVVLTHRSELATLLARLGERGERAVSNLTRNELLSSATQQAWQHVRSAMTANAYVAAASRA